jgi:hypothetical protein
VSYDSYKTTPPIEKNPIQELEIALEEAGCPIIFLEDSGPWDLHFNVTVGIWASPHENENGEIDIKKTVAYLKDLVDQMQGV